MSYENYMRNKMHRSLKPTVKGGYPLRIDSKQNQQTNEYVIYGATQVGKNLLPHPYYDTTDSAFTDNGDGSITASFMSEAGGGGNCGCSLCRYLPVTPGQTYTFSLNRENTDEGALYASVFQMTADDHDMVESIFGILDTYTFTAQENAAYIWISIWGVGGEGRQVTDTFRPMLELGDTATEYESYTETGVGTSTKDILRSSGNYVPKAGAEGTYDGVYVHVNDDGSIFYNGTNTGSTKYTNFTNRRYVDLTDPESVANCMIDPYKTYTMMTHVTSGETDCPRIFVQFRHPDTGYDMAISEDVIIKGSTYFTFCLADICKYYGLTAIYFQFFLGYGNGQTFNNATYQPHLYEGEAILDWEESQKHDYYIQLKNSSKNIVPFPYYNGEKTINGVQFTMQDDGGIVLNGTATQSTIYHFANSHADARYNKSLVKIPRGKYFIRCNHDSGTNLYFDFYAKNTSGSGNVRRAMYSTSASVKELETVIDCSAFDTSDGLDDFNFLWAAAYVNNGAECDNVVLYPFMIEGEQAEEYERYRDPEDVVVYIDAPLKEGQSVSYKADSLPALPLIKGSNIIKAQTEVKPSKIEVRYKD